MGSPAHDLTVETPLALGAAGRVSADANQTGVDVTGFEGWGRVDVSVTPVSGTTPTYDGKLQESDTLGGTYTDVSGAAIVQVTTGATVLQSLKVNWSAIKSFVRWADDVGGTSPVYDRCVLAQGAQKSYSPS